MNEKLKPCPFCGLELEKSLGFNFMEHPYGDGQCPAQGLIVWLEKTGVSGKEYPKAWNTRISL